MQIKDLRALLEQLPAEFDDKTVVIREFGHLTEGEDGKHFMLDKPIGLAYYDETTGELAVSERDMFDKYKNEGWFPVKEGLVNESYVMSYEDSCKKEVNEDGEGGGGEAGPAPADGYSGLDAVNGMGAPVLASRGVTGSGDVPSVAVKKKKKKRILDFAGFFTRP